MSEELYYEDDFRPNSPGLERVHPKAPPSPSPPPVVTKLFHPPISSPSSSSPRRQEKANRRKTRPTQGDWVLIREMSPHQSGIARQVSQQAFNSDSDTDDEDNEDLKDPTKPPARLMHLNGLKMPAETRQHTVPKFERTYTDIAADNFYDPNAVAQSIAQTTRAFYRVPDDRYKYFVNVYINGTQVEAFPDNCSELNLVSEAFVSSLKLDDPPKIPIRLPNGTLIKASGSVTTSCRFTEDGETFEVKFVVLPRCLHHVILCGSFLRRTKTDLVVGSRIQYKPLESAAPIQVCLNGTPQEQIMGSINGEEVIACPDIGSDVNVITEDYAHALGLVVAPDPDDSELFLVDGSFIPTCGILRGVEWRFGKPPTTSRHVERAKRLDTPSTPIAAWKFGTDASQGDAFVCDFYVVKKLTVLVILSSALLYSTNAFKACPQHFNRPNELKRRAEMQINHSNVAVIHKRPKLYATIKGVCKSVCDLFMGAGNIPGGPATFVDEEDHEEAVRRGQAERRIARLAPNDQPAANAQELFRRTQWDTAHPHHAMSPALQDGSAQASPNSSVAQPTISTPSLASTNTTQPTTTAATTPVPPSPTLVPINAPSALPPATFGQSAQLQGAPTPAPASAQET